MVYVRFVFVDFKLLITGTLAYWHTVTPVPAANGLSALKVLVKGAPGVQTTNCTKKT